MASFDQLPGRLNLSFRSGDAVSVSLDFNPIALTGLTVSAAIYSVVSGAQIVPLTVVVTNAAAGQCNVSLTDEQTAAIPAGTYRWEMSALDAGARRTYLAGFVEVTR